MVMILFEKGIFATAFFLTGSFCCFGFSFNVLTVFSVLGRKGRKQKSTERDDPCLKNLKSDEKERGQN